MASFFAPAAFLLLRPRGTIYNSALPNGCGRSSGVEHYLAKVRVVSSNLIARSNKLSDRNEDQVTGLAPPRSCSACRRAFWMACSPGSSVSAFSTVRRAFRPRVHRAPAQPVAMPPAPHHCLPPPRSGHAASHPFHTTLRCCRTRRGLPPTARRARAAMPPSRSSLLFPSRPTISPRLEDAVWSAAHFSLALPGGNQYVTPYPKDAGVAQG